MTRQLSMRRGSGLRRVATNKIKRESLFSTRLSISQRSCRFITTQSDLTSSRKDLISRCSITRTQGLTFKKRRGDRKPRSPVQCLTKLQTLSRSQVCLLQPIGKTDSSLSRKTKESLLPTRSKSRRRASQGLESTRVTKPWTELLGR